MIPATKEVLRTSETGALKMSYEEFLAWSDEDTHAEWVDGEVTLFMPPIRIHQTTEGFLYKLLSLYIDTFNWGQLLIAPFEMRLSRSAREPDILFIATENLWRLTPERLVGPADLLIELVSAGSVKRDRQEKFREYAEAGVHEYWIIDPRPTQRRADFFRLEEAGGGYVRFGSEADERVESQVVPGFWLRPVWLWQGDRLNPLLIFWAILSPEQRQQVERMVRDEQV
jgi:Uma2 family endonuclease